MSAATRFWRGWGRRAIGAVLAVALAVLSIAMASGWLHETLRPEIEDLANGAIAGELEIGELRGSLLREVELRDVVLLHEGRTEARIAVARLRYRLLPLLAGELVVDVLELRGVELSVSEAAEGWSLARALSASPQAEEPPQSATPSGLPLPLQIYALRVRDLSASVEAAGQPPWVVRNFEMDASGRAYGERFEAAIEHWIARIEAGDRPPIDLDVALTGVVDGEVANLAVEKFELTSAESRVVLSGGLGSAEAVRAQLEFAPAAVADLSAWLPGLRVRHALRGRVSIDGPWEASRLELDLTSAEAVLAAQLELNLREPSLDRISGRAQLSRLSLGDVVEDLRGVVEAKLRIENGRADIESSLLVEGGTLTVEGTASLAAPYSAELQFSTQHLDPSKLLPSRPELAGEILSTGLVTGEGSSLDDAQGAASFRLAPSRLGELLEIEGEGRVRLAEQSLLFDALSLRSKSSRFAASGRIALGDPGRTALDVVAESPDIGPWLALGGLTGRGALNAKAEIRGQLDDLEVHMDATASDLDVASVQLVAGRLQVDAELAESESTFETRVDLEGVVAPVAIDSLEAVVRTQLRGSRIESVVRSFEARAASGTWTLAQPADVSIDEGSAEFGELSIENGDGRIDVRGAIGPRGPQTLRVEVAAWPLRSLHEAVPALEGFEGVAELAVQLGGLAARPEVELSARISDFAVDLDKSLGEAGVATPGGAAIGTVRAGVELEAEVRDGALRAEATFDQGLERRLRLTGALPVALAWAEGFVAEARGDIDATLRGEAIDLAFLNGLTEGVARNIAGQLSVDARVQGPPDAPAISGALSVRGGAFAIEGVGVDYADVEVDATLAGGIAEITRFSASSAEGRLGATGRLAVKGDALDSVEARLTLSEWPLVRSHSYRAVVGGDLNVTGALDSLVVNGDLAILSGTLRPVLDLLVDAPPPRDPTISLAEPEAPTAGNGEALEAVKPASSAAANPLDEIVDSLAMDVRLTATRNLWVKHENAQLELSADLALTKDSRKPVAVAGEIRGVRGWAELYGRRFRLTEGSVAFTGGVPIDPTLDILGRYQTAGYSFDAMVTGTASAPVLELRSNPELEKADILAVLLFGRPISELGEGEQASLSQQATGVATGVGATMLGQRATQALGLEDLGLQVEELSTDRAAVGAYIGEKTFVSATQEFAPSYRRLFRIEYEFVSGWSLATSTSTDGDSRADLLWRIRY